MLLMIKTYARIREERGQGMAEYALILALIAVIAITALTNLGAGVVAQLNAVTAAL